MSLICLKSVMADLGLPNSYVLSCLAGKALHQTCAVPLGWWVHVYHCQSSAITILLMHESILDHGRV